MSRFELKLWKNISGTLRYYTISEAANQCVLARTMEWTENYPRKLTVVLDNRTTNQDDNFLSATFDGWDTGAKGAVEIGDQVEYSVYATNSIATKTRVFYGIITELAQKSDGMLMVTARDYLEKFEHLVPDRVFYASYLDEKQKSWTQGTGAVAITGCSESGIVMPPVTVRFAWEDSKRTLSGTGDWFADGYLWDGTNHWYVAQKFRAEGDGLIGLMAKYRSWNVVNPCHLHVEIRPDLAGLPSDTVLAIATYTLPLGTETTTPHDFDFGSSSHETVALTANGEYWAVFYCDHGAGDADAVAMCYHTDPSSEYEHFYYYQVGVGPWTPTTLAEELHMELDFANYLNVDPKDYYRSGTNIIVRQEIPVKASDNYYSSTNLKRGKVSYYYGTVTSEAIFDWLIAFDASFTGITHSDLDTTYSTYQTRGKSIGECFRELADGFETTGGHSGYQRAIAHYESGGNHYVKVGFKNTTTKPFTFSHGDDSSTDDELRIVMVDLKKTTQMRSATAIVHGVGPSGEPIVVERDDRAKSGSFRAKSAMHLTVTLTDESINNLTAADEKAWQLLDSVTRDTWEGTIIVSGVYPDLFMLNTSDPSYGSGLNITVNYSPLAISAETLHVKGIILHENTTEIQVTNQDLFVMNSLTDTRGKAERSEAFLAPDNPYEVIFISGYSDTVVTADSLYMELDNAEDTRITGLQRVLATKFTNSRYNSVTYHAEFEMGNGWTTDGGTKVNRLELWTASSGGIWMATASIIGSDQFHKWRKTKVIAEIHTKAS